MKTYCLGLAALSIFSVALGASPAVQVKLNVAGAPKMGKPFTVNVQIDVPTGYHIYGPKDESGIPTSIAFSGPKGFQSKVAFPKTAVFKNLDGTSSAVYMGHTTIPVVVTPPKGAKGKQSLTFKVTTQACNDHTCLPPSTANITISTQLK